MENGGFFSILDQIPQIGQTKVFPLSFLYLQFIATSLLVIVHLEFAVMQDTGITILMKNCPTEQMFNLQFCYSNLYQVGELAKSFLWEPFFPVGLDDTILHAMLLLSKHRLHVLPVIQQQPEAGLIGFVTQVSAAELSTALELWIEAQASS